jgi:hypothetical protein
MSTPNPLSQKLRLKAKNIAKLLQEYIEIRYGDETYRLGDKEWRESRGEKGNPPGTSGNPPKIRVVSTPRNIYLQEAPSETSNETSQNSNATTATANVINPVFQALQELGELTEKEIIGFQLENRYGIIQDLGVVERMECSALLPWLRKLASQITYILETREQYSAEIKAVYPELLTDLENARSACDRLKTILANQRGILNSNQYSSFVAEILHYAKIAQQAALQLADHHEAFVTETVSPLEGGPETEWVFKEEKEEFPPKPPKPKEET